MATVRLELLCLPFYLFPQQTILYKALLLQNEAAAGVRRQLSGDEPPELPSYPHNNSECRQRHLTCQSFVLPRTYLLIYLCPYERPMVSTALNSLLLINGLLLLINLLILASNRW